MCSAEAPERPYLDPKDPRTTLRQRVWEALLSLPGQFRFENAIAGINATDLNALNTLLGTAIENEVVRALNGLREVWDPNSEWVPYRFERSSQAFPDVRLVKRDVGEPEIALGIELKGWFLLAKESVPSFRYRVAAGACAPHDLLCVVPWHLSDAVAGTARVVEPWVESARYAAEYRDYWWQHVREAGGDTGLNQPTNPTPYPSKSDLIDVVPVSDGGGNFGRLPRSRPLMDDFIERTAQHEILGIPVQSWYSFLSAHRADWTNDEILGAVEATFTRRVRRRSELTLEAAEDLASHLRSIGQILNPRDVE